MCCQKLLLILQKEKSKLDYVYDWTTYSNLKDRAKLKKKPKIQTNSTSIENNNHFIRSQTFSHCIEEIDNQNNIKMKIEDIDDSKKKYDSSMSNKADIDEFDSPGLDPKNETECCKM